MIDWPLLQVYITNISQFQLPYNVSETLQCGLSAYFRRLLSQASESVIRGRQANLPSIYVCSGYLQFGPLVYTSLLTTEASHLILKPDFSLGLPIMLESLAYKPTGIPLYLFYQ